MPADDRSPRIDLKHAGEWLSVAGMPAAHQWFSDRHQLSQCLKPSPTLQHEASGPQQRFRHSERPGFQQGAGSESGNEHPARLPPPNAAAASIPFRVIPMPPDRVRTSAHPSAKILSSPGCLIPVESDALTISYMETWMPITCGFLRKAVKNGKSVRQNGRGA